MGKLSSVYKNSNLSWYTPFNIIFSFSIFSLSGNTYQFLLDFTIIYASIKTLQYFSITDIVLYSSSIIGWIGFLLAHGICKLYFYKAHRPIVSPSFILQFNQYNNLFFLFPAGINNAFFLHYNFHNGFCQFFICIPACKMIAFFYRHIFC